MIESSDYFETPHRTERLQLLMHLVSNATEIPYLRAPQGAGKTRFAKELAARLGSDYTVVWLVAGADQPLREQLVNELGLTAGDNDWLVNAIERSPDRPLLLIVDDAEHLQLAEVADLLDLGQAGAHLLLVGTGELAQSKGNWDLRFVDLPPFTEEETRAFLEQQGRLEPGGAGARTAAALHRASEGLPGLLLDALDTLPEEMPEPSPSSIPARRTPWGLITVGAVVIGLAGLVLYFQDAINAWLEPKTAATALPGESPPATPSVSADNVSAPEPPVFKSQVVAAPEVRATEASGMAVSDNPPAEPAAAMPETVEVESDARAEMAAALAEDDGAETPDPVLDAIIDEAIKAAAQPPQSEVSPVSTAQVAAAGAQASGGETVATADPVEVPPVAAGAPPSSAVVAPEKPPVKPAVEVVPSKDKAPSRSSPVQRPKAEAGAPSGGAAWLLAQPDSAYTLQLVGARDRQAIADFVRRHGIEQPHAIFERDLNGKPWYSLVAGSYPDRQAAVAARARLPRSITKAGVWPRTFASIRQQMKTNN